MTPKSKFFPIKSFLLILIIFAGFLRFSSLNWDQSLSYHPDERNIAAAVTQLEFPWSLDPGFHAYNGFFIYLLRLVAEITASLTNNSSWLTDWGHINLLGRFLSASFSTASIPLFFLLGNLLVGPSLGLLAAALATASPGFIQYAHYGVTESLLVFWLLIISSLCIQTLKKSSTLSFAKLALICGLAIGTKTSAVSFLVLPLFTWLTTTSQRNFFHSIFVGVYFALLTFLTFFVVSPYSFLSSNKFLESMAYEKGVVIGELSVPYNLQFTVTPPYLYFLKNLPWQVGPPVAIFGLLGIIFWLIHDLKYKKIHSLPLLLFSLAYFAYIGQWHTKFIRYLLPLLPALILSASWLLLKISARLRYLGRFLIFLTLSISFLWSLAYFSVFSSPHTRIVASQWIYQNLPGTSTILHEHWDDQLPSSLPGYVNNFNFLEVKSYDQDTKEKFTELTNQLDQGDFYIISSRRVYGSILNNPQKYPLMSVFYSELFAGKLNYKLVKTFSSYPRFGNLVINDDSSEETFQVYDHPTVYIFQKK